jgi:hypothetical protein
MSVQAEDGFTAAADAGSGGDAPFVAAPLADGLRRWLPIAGPLFSLGILAAVIWRLQELDFGAVWSRIPTAPGFWLLFPFYYFALSIADWVIFRRLWRIPAAGIGALLRKRLSNDLLLGYSGELYFYTWARRRADISGAPFGAIKDVAILSAIAGNVVTLILFALAYPVLGQANLGIQPHIALLSVVIIVGPSLLAMILRGHLFSLPAAETRFVLAVHFVRLIAVIALTILLWHFALPDVTLRWWMTLAALQILVSRLPLVPNKDVVFAGICVLLIGRDTGVVALTAQIAALVLIGHILVAGGLTAAWAVSRRRTGGRS